MLVYIVPFFVNSLSLSSDLDLAKACFYSIEASDDIEVVIYNQGSLTNASLDNFMKSYNFKYHIIGNGENVGIPLARYHCLQFVWLNIPNVTYVAEIHLDMYFTANWTKPLIAYLENSDEPCVSPRILYYEPNTTSGVFKVTGVDSPIKFDGDLKNKISILESYKENKIVTGFVHPVIHKAKILKEICPYDPKFLKGMHGFEDDSILLGYNYYIGTRNKWLPKINFNSCVYHQALAQRMSLDNFDSEMEKNLNGLYAQYGAYGFKELNRILEGYDLFQKLYNLSQPFNIFIFSDQKIV